MSDTIVVALIGAAASIAGSIISMLVSAKKARQQANITIYRIDQLEQKVHKHNNVIERMYRLEGRATELEHDVKDLKGYHKPANN